MRDLSRRNANVMAHDHLRGKGMEVFTPMKELIMIIGGKRQRRNVPVIQDLLFVHTSKELLDPEVMRFPNLQYRYCQGKSVHEPLTVRELEMERFILAVTETANPRYYMPGELTPAMYGRQVHIVGGPLDGFKGRLLSVKGMRKRRLIVEIPDLLVSAVEVSPEFIKLL